MTPSATPTKTGMFASLTNPTYRLLFWSGAIAFLSVQAQFVARGWLANDLTGTNTGLGAVYMAFGVPMLLATPFAGVVADRFSKRSILITTQAAFGLSALWIGLGVQFGFIQYWMLLVVSVVQALGFSFLAPARMAMTSELVGRELLTNAIVLGQMSLNTTRIFGPALAGVGISIAWFGLAGVYFAATLISVVAILMLLPLPTGIAARQGPPLSPTRQFTEGLKYVRDHREVKLLIFTSFIVVMVAFPYVAFMPRVATEMFDVGATGYGLLSAISAVGAVLISFYAARNSSRASTWKLQTTAGFTFGIGVVLLAGAPVFPLALAAVFVIGAGSSAFQSMNNSLVLGLTDSGFHGRLQSLMMLSFSGFGMAALPLGMLADRIGLRPTFTIMGAITIAMMVVYLSIRGPADAENGRQVADA